MLSIIKKTLILNKSEKIRIKQNKLNNSLKNVIKLYKK